MKVTIRLKNEPRTVALRELAKGQLGVLAAFPDVAVVGTGTGGAVILSPRGPAYHTADDDSQVRLLEPGAYHTADDDCQVRLLEPGESFTLTA